MFKVIAGKYSNANALNSRLRLIASILYIRAIRKHGVGIQLRPIGGKESFLNGIHCEDTVVTLWYEFKVDNEWSSGIVAIADKN